MNRILVVDDDRNLVETLSDVLKAHGWEVDGVFSGEEAIEAFRENEYVAVLMDIVMTGMDGVQALQVMREERPERRILLMTANATNDLIQSAEREDAMRILPKAAGLEHVLQTLERLLQRSGSILIVDNDRAFLQSLSDGLKKKGFLTVEERNLDTAIRHLHSEPRSAIVLRYRIDGLEPTGSVLAIRAITPAMALILYGDLIPTLDLTDARTRHDWLVARIQKPFSLEHLTDFLDELLVTQ